jgi:hypothetical protein
VPYGVRAQAFVEEALRWLPDGGASREVAIEKEVIGLAPAVAAIERATVLVADDNVCCSMCAACWPQSARSRRGVRAPKVQRLDV